MATESVDDSSSPPLPETGDKDDSSNLSNGSSSVNNDGDNSNDIELQDTSKSNKRRPSLGEINENEEMNTDSNDPTTTTTTITTTSNSKEDEKDSNNDKSIDNNNNNNNNNESNNSENNNNNNNATTNGTISLDEDNISMTSEGDESIGGAQLGYDEEGKMLPAFENVDDELLSFNSESDFAIFQKQLNGDIPLQRLVAVKRMVSGCPHWGTEAALSLIPRFASISNDKELVIRQTIAEQLGPFAKYLIEATNNSKKAHNIVIKELLPLMKDMLRDAGEIRQGAGNSLIMIAELLTEVEVHEHVLKIVLHMAHDDSDDQKITALPLLADLAPIVGHSVCRNYLSSDLNALSQDNSFRVRKSTVQYFGPICEQLGADDVEKQLLPVFQQLCSDSIWSVRKGCVESFVDVANSVHQETRGKLIPIMEKFLNDSSRWVRNAAYEHLGPFLSVLTSDQIKPELVKYFVNIPHLSSAEADADCTNHCAFNFPAVAQTLGPDRWDELNDLYNILVRKTFKSRKTLACSIHEICKILGTEKTERYLMSAIEFFLKDIDDIREGIIKNLWKLLAVFTDARRQEYISQLWELASESDVNWRFRLLLAQQLEEVIPLYPAKVVYEQFVPLTFQLCNDRMADVRYAAVDPVKDLINCFYNAEQTDSVEGVIKKCHTIRDGKTYAKRLLFIRICEACFGKINKDLYDKNFFESVLKYQDDKIMNVRFCLARFIKSKLFTNDTYKNSDLLKKAIEKLKNDPEDVEVRRFFSNDDEIETFLRSYKSSQPMVTANVNNQNMGRQDDEDSESSLYSSSDDDLPNDGTKETPTKGGPIASDNNNNSNENENNNNDNTNDASKDDAVNGNQENNDNTNEAPKDEASNDNADDKNENNNIDNINDNNENKEADKEANKDADVDADKDKDKDDIDDSSDDSFDDDADDDSPRKDKVTDAKLQKKISNIDLESAAKDSNNPESAKGAGPDIADIGPDGRLVHQPTPYRLNILDDDDDDDDEDDDNNNKDKDTNKDSENSSAKDEKESDTNETDATDSTTNATKDSNENDSVVDSLVSSGDDNAAENGIENGGDNKTYQNGIENENENDAAKETEANADAPTDG